MVCGEASRPSRSRAICCRDPSRRSVRYPAFTPEPCRWPAHRRIDARHHVRRAQPRVRDIFIPSGLQFFVERLTHIGDFLHQRETSRHRARGAHRAHHQLKGRFDLGLPRAFREEFRRREHGFHHRPQIPIGFMNRAIGPPAQAADRRPRNAGPARVEMNCAVDG